jgi:hypothetical protein
MTLRLKHVFATLAIAVLASGCVIATGGNEHGKGPAQGASNCMTSEDGRAVACGGKAEHCMKSQDGRAVACGGRADYCMKSDDGHAVACGGRADYCAKSDDGKAVACGGAQ